MKNSRSLVGFSGMHADVCINMHSVHQSTSSLKCPLNASLDESINHELLILIDCN